LKALKSRAIGGANVLEEQMTGGFPHSELLGGGAAVAPSGTVMRACSFPDPGQRVAIPPAADCCIGASACLPDHRPSAHFDIAGTAAAPRIADAQRRLTIRTARTTGSNATRASFFVDHRCDTRVAFMRAVVGSLMLHCTRTEAATTGMDGLAMAASVESQHLSTRQRRTTKAAQGRCRPSRRR